LRQTLLRSIYEKHVYHAEQTGASAKSRDVVGNMLLGKASHVEAHYDAAVTALLCAELARMQDNRTLAGIWLERARDNIDRYREVGRERASRAIHTGAVALGAPAMMPAAVFGIVQARRARKELESRSADLERTYRLALR
jgi:hypothetical protein